MESYPWFSACSRIRSRMSCLFIMGWSIAPLVRMSTVNFFLTGEIVRTFRYLDGPCGPCRIHPTKVRNPTVRETHRSCTIGFSANQSITARKNCKLFSDTERQSENRSIPLRTFVFRCGTSVILQFPSGRIKTFGCGIVPRR